MKLKYLLMFTATLSQLYGQQMGGFGGPAVMGRGTGSGTGQRGGADLGIGFFGGVMGTIDSGLTGLELNPNGDIASRAGKGLDGYAGVFGSKVLRRGSFGINYTGHYRLYSGGQDISGIDQNLALYTSRQLSKRSNVSVFSNASTTNRPFGFNIGGIGLDPTASTLYTNTGEIFDNRIYNAVAGGEYSMQRSARLSVAFNGTGFITRRTGGILFGVNGATAGASIAYRLSRRQTISVGYQFLMFDFTRNFGDSYGNGANASYSLQLSRRVQLGIQAGFYRLESLGVRTAAVDPIIAALIGVSSVNEVFHSVTILPTGTATASYRVSRFHDLSVAATVMATPGNGVINTSRNTTVSGSYTYSGIRNLGLNAGASYTRLSSLIAGNQVFGSIQVNANASRRIAQQLFLTVGVGNRRFLTTETTNFSKNSYFASFGLTWSPNAIPVSIR